MVSQDKRCSRGGGGCCAILSPLRVLAVPVPTLLTHHRGPRVFYGAAQGNSLLLLSWSCTWPVSPGAFPVLEHEAAGGQALQPTGPAPARE